MASSRYSSRRYARTGRRSSGGTKRQLVWARQDVLVNVADATVDLLEPYRQRRGVTATPGLTVLRIRGDFIAFNGDPPDGSLFAGIRRCQTDEVAAGNGPFSEPHADWMYYQRMFSGDGNGRVYEMDVRSRRKMHELEQTLCLFVQTPGPETPGTLTGTVSVLLALP